jgi:hypothetical protein
MEWLAFFVLLVVGLTAAGAFTLSNGAVTRAIGKLERTYRRQKALELEQLEAQAVARRRQEVHALLERSGGWRAVLDQLLADALPATGAGIGPEGVLEVSAVPAPRFTAAGSNGCDFLFTTSPDALRKFRLLGRKDEVVPLDAALHPAARVEIQSVWDHLAARRLTGDLPVLPRQAAWYVAPRARPQAKEGER